MKKLSVLLALMLCVTIGGVYATWTYSETNDIYDAEYEAKVTLEDAVSTGSAGTYKVESNLVLTVDQANTDHEAKLVFSANNGEEIFLKVTFTPADGASEDIKKNAVPTELYFKTTVPMQYKMDAQGNYSATGTPADIFTFSNPSDGNFSANVVWNPEANGTFTYTLNQDDLEDMISLSQTFKLDVKAEYDAFREALAGNIVVHVTDGTINQNGNQAGN